MTPEGPRAVWTMAHRSDQENAAGITKAIILECSRIMGIHAIPPSGFTVSAGEETFRIEVVMSQNGGSTLQQNMQKIMSNVTQQLRGLTANIFDLQVHH